ncbi:MAG: hypothetical protein ABR961_14225 [Thermoanaerobaculaceae bacterium]|jgi:hypothetical protein
MCLLLLLVGLGVSAQENTGYVAILPGYQFPSGSQNLTFTPLSANLAQKDNWLASLDFGWYVTDHIGLHAGYIYMPNDYELHLWNGSTDLGTSTISHKANIFEVGPEFLWEPQCYCGQVYAQLNLGRTFGSSNFTYGGRGYAVKDTGGGEWSLGAALGYRHFFNDFVGWTIQSAFHHVNYWPSGNLWDVRTGLDFRFSKAAPPLPTSPPPRPTPRPTPLPPPPPPTTRTPAPPPTPPAAQTAPEMITITPDESVLHFNTDK